MTIFQSKAYFLWFVFPNSPLDKWKEKNESLALAFSDNNSNILSESSRINIIFNHPTDPVMKPLNKKWCTAKLAVKI